MLLVSLWFYIGVAISIIFYYTLPKKIQPLLLIIYNIVFFFFASPLCTMCYLFACILITWFCGIKMQAGGEKRKRFFLGLGLVTNFLMLGTLKYSGALIADANTILRFFNYEIDAGGMSLLAPIGISFYTFEAVGYLLEVYWGVSAAEESCFRLGVFLSYFPALTSGPISKYSKCKESFFSPHFYSADKMWQGVYRILWGILKKLVISERLAYFVDPVFNSVSDYKGVYIWIASFAFMLQLYTDFSGCMDIILGISECYGIDLPENFKTPFYSKTVQEFWQRWHITLGGWMRDYVMYPIMRSKRYRQITKSFQSVMGKKMASQIASYLAMLVVWLLIGLWHGGEWKYILGEGMWF